MKLREKLTILLIHPAAPLLAAAVGILLALPSLGAGWLADDYWHRAVFSNTTNQDKNFPGNTGRPLDLFHFLSGDPQTNHALMDAGHLPWWADPNAKAAFWRPLTCLTHLLDYRLWPGHPSLMHAQSILWYGLLILLISLFYRDIMGPTLAAGLAALLFAIDDAHAMPVAFLANRNTLIAAVFALLTLAAHHHWRRYNSIPALFFAPLCLLLSLLAKESGLATFAYLLAYALFYDTTSLKSRLRSLLPYLFIIICWRIAWSYLDYGVHAIGWYIDPLHEPGRFLLAATWRIPQLIAGLLTPLSANLVFILGPANPFHIAAAVICCLLVAAAFFNLIKTDRTARFWAAGAFLSIIPLATTLPCDRMLLFASIGALPLIALFLTRLPDYVQSARRSFAQRFSRRLFAWLLIFTHGIAAPLILVISAAAPMGPPSLFQKMTHIEADDTAIAQQDLIVVNPPYSLLSAYFQVARQLDGRPAAQHLRVLSSGFFPITITRADDHTLIVHPQNGFTPLVFDHIFRRPENPMRLHETVQLTGLTIEITQVNTNHQPTEARFTFQHPLESPHYCWRYWHQGRYQPFTPPQPGQSVTITLTGN